MVRIRKLVTVVEDTLSDGGRETRRPGRKVAALAVLENPFAGRFVEDLTQSEIAERVGVSQMHVSRILRSTLDYLREQVNEGEEEESA